MCTQYYEQEHDGSYTSSEYSDDDTIDEENQTPFDLIHVKVYTNNSYKWNKVMRYMKYSMDPVAPRQCMNALTGGLYIDSNNRPILNGSRKSLGLYGVIDASAPLGDRTPFKLYYDNPEQYEDHVGVTVPHILKKRFFDRKKELS
jgi:hypothetical protein